MEKLKRGKHGFIMVEVMMAVTVVLIVMSSLLSASRMEHWRTMEKISKREQYYAGLSAVRLMTLGISEGGYVCDESTQELKLVFESEAEEERLEIPVQVRSRKEEDTLIVSAQGISLTLKQEGEGWVPQRYVFESEDAE